MVVTGIHCAPCSSISAAESTLVMYTVFLFIMFLISRRFFPFPLFLCSLQFAVLMWILTYVGALFNGLTLLILCKEQSHAV